MINSLAFLGEEVLDEGVDVDPLLSLEDRFILQEVSKLILCEGKSVDNLRIDHLLSSHVLVAIEVER